MHSACVLRFTKPLAVVWMGAMRYSLLPFLLLSQVAFADLEGGITAYNSGDHEVAHKEFAAAAKAGDPHGMHLLASLYYQGHGVDKDIAIAVKGFKAAAAKGWGASMYNLALMYHKGDGVEVDMEQAVSYYTDAGKQGHLEAAFSLGQLYRKGDGVEVTPKRALAYYKFAAMRAHIPAMNEYGLMFVQGIGVEKDLYQGYGWIAIAADTRDAQARKNLSKLRDMLREEVELEKAKAKQAEIMEQMAKTGIFRTSLTFAIGQVGGQSIFLEETCLPPHEKFRSITREYKTGDAFGTYRQYRIEKYLEHGGDRPLPVVVITDLLTRKKAEITYRESHVFPPE